LCNIALSFHVDNSSHDSNAQSGILLNAKKNFLSLLPLPNPNDMKRQIAMLGVESIQDTTRQKHTPPSNFTTLALLYPPGLMGGYRNQVIRFIGLCLYAKQKNITQLYKPSLLWSTQLTKHGIGTNVQWLPIPMDWIFDIDYWNSVAQTEGLPRIVDSLPDDPDCWRKGLFDGYNTSEWDPLAKAAFLESGSLVGVTNESYRMISNDPTFKARRTDVLATVSHCKRPVVYGGGKMGGRLWNDMMKLREKYIPLPDNLDSAVLRALQPAPKWQKLANSCLSQAMMEKPYVALHARVELEMLSHPCGKTMERNLTKILDQVNTLVESKQLSQSSTGEEQLERLFIAVSRSGMEYNSYYNEKLQDIAGYNLNELNRYTNTTSNTKLGRSLAIFECGERLLGAFYRQHPDVPDHGSLLQAVINFHLAVNAAIFVGARGSSYSTDVWTTRYHLGKGDENYRYTLDGKVEKIENGGLPDPHVNCGTLNKRAPRQKQMQMRAMVKKP
jgi:hypothetical protein